jgi:GMP synthase-like glutamine amidotransferase
MRFLTFEHMPWEGPGIHLLRSAKRWGVQLEVIEVWHEPIPDLTPYDALIVLGGEANVDQEEKYPFLSAEKAVIRRSIEEDRPYLGFCLGHQLLADALGANVGDNFCRSVGFIEGQLTKEGSHHPLFQRHPQTFPLFKWHAQAILPPVPKHIEVLVTSSECLVEAISVTHRAHIVGLQFDNHAATRVNVTKWLEEDSNWLSHSSGANPSKVLTDATRLEKSAAEQFEILFSNFVDLVSVSA